MELIELVNWEQAATEEIQRRARNGSKAKITKHYAAYEGSQEVAFVALDRHPQDSERLTLYEMFVPRALRRNGIGTRLLKEIERIARDEGYSSVHLCPEPLDAAYSREGLIAWYAERGYIEIQDPKGLIKVVAGTGAPSAR
jgi:GNAT superfamily N-acetyltransferase